MNEDKSTYKISYLDWDENELHTEEYDAVDIKAATEYATQEHKKYGAELINVKLIDEED